MSDPPKCSEPHRKTRLGGSLAILIALALGSAVASAQMITKTEHFDADPNWDGHNNRATEPAPRQITQDFGYSATTTWAGGPAGEIGGFITPAAEPAWYAKVLPADLTFDDPFTVSGKFNEQFGGGGHSVIGLFNSNTANEWRTANTMGVRLYGRGDYFYAYPEYGTSQWRAGQTSFPGSGGDDFHFVSGFTSPLHTFSLNYNPDGPAGSGILTTTIDNQNSVCTIPAEQRADGATFNRFGILNVMKTADSPGRLWMDNLTINGQLENFSADPHWEGFNNRNTYTTTNVRPRFDFGYSGATSHAGGASPGELGGVVWRGDSDPQFNGDHMAYYGDPLQQTLDLNRPLHASGKISLNRGVSDSTTLIGFFHHADSIRNEISDYSTPENFVGAAIEGPSSEGFFFYPTFMTDVEDGHGDGQNAPHISPNGASHNWDLDYDPLGGSGSGRINLMLDGQLATLDLKSSDRLVGAHFDRFGIITTQADGLSQTVYFDDLMYTVSVPEPSTSAALFLLTSAALRQRRRQRPEGGI